MLCLKYKIANIINLVLLFSCLSAYANQKFTSESCFKSDFDFKVEKKAKYFGLLKNKFQGSKSKCILQLKTKSLMETIWDIDICRTPIHLKKTEKGSQDVYKKPSRCTGSEKKGFCTQLTELFTVIQDEGLIFAEGERELLTTNHGKLYCFNLLLKKYLEKNVLFSNYESVPNIYNEKSTEPIKINEQVAPIKTKAITNKVIPKKKQDIEPEVIEEIKKELEPIDEASLKAVF